MPMDLPPQAWPAYEVQMVREVGAESSARLPSSAAPVALVAQQAPAVQVANRVMGVCLVISNDGSEPRDSAAYMTGFGGAARAYLRLYEGRNVRANAGKVISVTNPKNGVLHLQDSENGTYSYFPNAGFFGTDTVTAVVDIGGVTIKVIQTFKVIDGITGGDQTQKVHCGSKDIYRRISLNGGSDPNPSSG